MPETSSSLITVPAAVISAALSAGGAESRRCLRDWLLTVPDPRRRGWHRLEFVLALAVCAFAAAGNDSPSAIAEWAAGCSRETLLLLGGRRCPLTGRVRAPSTRTFGRVLGDVSADAVNQALHGFLDVMPAAPAEDLPEVTRHEREQRRVAAAAREPGLPGCSRRPPATGRPPAARSARTAAGSACCRRSAWTRAGPSPSAR